jgi:hypothetical protein
MGAAVCRIDKERGHPQAWMGISNWLIHAFFGLRFSTLIVGLKSGLSDAFV